MSDPVFTWEEETVDRLVIRGAGARLTFSRLGDRWTHRLGFGEPTVTGAWLETELIAAIETDTERDDPARVVSPVYQEIHRHELPGDPVRGPCVLLTGHLHQHHFSAAVHLHRDPDEPGSATLKVDLADRCRAPVSSLASTYLVRLGSGSLAAAEPHKIRWCETTDHSLELELRCERPGLMGLGEAGRSAVRVQAVAAIAPGVFTHRLRYSWHWRWRT